MRILAALGLSAALALGAPAGAQIYTQDELEAQGQQPRRDNTAVAALAALLALGVIGAIVDDDDDDDDRDEARRRGDRHDGWDRSDWDWEDDRRGGRVLTAECVRHVRGGQRVLSGACLRDHGYRARLPDHCLSWVRAGGRDREVYDMRCLRGSGFYVR